MTPETFESIFTVKWTHGRKQASQMSDLNENLASPFYCEIDIDQTWQCFIFLSDFMVTTKVGVWNHTFLLISCSTRCDAVLSSKHQTRTLPQR